MKNPKIVVTDNRAEWYMKAGLWPKHLQRSYPLKRKIELSRQKFNKLYSQQPKPDNESS